jgi:hypothetical protein
MVRKLWGSGAPGASPSFSHNLEADLEGPEWNRSPGAFKPLD